MKTANMVLGLANVLLLAGVARAQVSNERQAATPCSGRVVGTVGIVDLDCGRRGCAIRLAGPGAGSSLWTPSWSFTAEPRIRTIAPGGPAAGALRAGDRIVAVDGVLITTLEGGRRFANLVPDSTVTIRYRREGRTFEATLRAVPRCGPALEGGPAIAEPIRTSDSVSGRAIVWHGPGVLIQTWTAEDGRRTIVTLPTLEAVVRESGDRAAVEIPEARYGMNFACGPCSSTTRDGRRVWRFSNPVEVMGVAEGGPAERAGIRAGDRITRVGGEPIDSRRGGELFSGVRPGVRVELTVVGTDGRERMVTLVPGGRE